MPKAKATIIPIAGESMDSRADLRPVDSAPAAAPPDPWARVRSLASRQLDRFVALEPKVLAGDDPDAVHDIRVASRRLQQVLDLLYPKPRPPEVRRLRRQIRRSRRALGEVRNCDVLLERMRGKLARKRLARREAWTAAELYLAERRAQVQAKAVRKLSKVNFGAFYVRLKGWLSPDATDAPPAQEGLAPAENPHDFNARFSEDLSRSWENFETRVADSHRDPRPQVIHAVRISSKRLRYLAEIVQAFDVSGSAEAVTWLRGVQQHLGDWHDLEVLERVLIAMVARREFLRNSLETAIAVEKLILGTRSLKKDFAERYFAMTRSTAEFARLKEWVAYLLESPAAWVNN